MMEVQSWNVRAHFQDDDGDGQGGADPETPPHVDQFGTGTSIFATGHRLEPHAANRATGRLRLPDLRMHRAGVNSAGRLRLWLALFLCQKPLRLFGELGSAAGRTEMIEVSGIGNCAPISPDRSASRRPGRFQWKMVPDGARSLNLTLRP